MRLDDDPLFNKQLQEIERKASALRRERVEKALAAFSRLGINPGTFIRVRHDQCAVGTMYKFEGVRSVSSAWVEVMARKSLKNGELSKHNSRVTIYGTDTLEVIE